MAAFDRAIGAGHGIELDVQLTADGDVIVFHDATLDRMADAHGRVDRMSRAQLEAIRLRDYRETLQALDTVLVHIGGRVPVLIEMKTFDRTHAAVALATRRAIEGYRGELAVMGFDPRAIGWFARHAETVVRGLCVTQDGRDPGPFGLRRRSEDAVSVWHGRPHFIAHDVQSLPSPLTASARKAGIPVLTWTIRSEADRARAAAHADQIIFEAAADTAQDAH